jgi:HTH-type transcriptional regulator / antitoxin HipB
MDYPLLLPEQLKSHLKSLRKARGLTQLQLGRLLGLGQVRVAEIEANPAAISVDQLFKLLSVLDVSVVLRDNATHNEAVEPKVGKVVASKPRELGSKSNKGRW